MAAYYFFDVPVYRLAEERYYSQMDEYIDRALFPPNMPYSGALRDSERRNPNENVGIREHLGQAYGGAWRYNEIIGYIRLHFLGSQIRGEYYGVRKKRVVRTRTKVLDYRTWKLVSEIEIPQESTSPEIFQLIMEYLTDCKAEMKGRYVDSGLLEVIGPYVNWRALWDLSWSRERQP